MPVSNSPLFVYASILEPWTKLAMNSPAVVGLRLNLLPWLWLTAPAMASQETRRMISEKQAALHETGLVMSQAPFCFWLDTVSACLSGNPHAAFSSAMINGSRRVARPANRRVRANQKRLGS